MILLNFFNNKEMRMKCHRLNEVLELLQPYWSKDPDLSLMQIMQKIADEAGFDKPLAALKKITKKTLKLRY